MNKANDLVAEAVTALHDLLGLPVTHETGGGEAVLRIQQGVGATDFRVRAVPRLNRAQLAEAVTDLAGHEDQVLVAERVTPDQGRQLREARVNYLDAGGNAYLHAAGIMILVEGQRPAKKEQQITGRAFQPAGMKVLFVLLNEPERANEAYRDVALLASTSPATIKYVLDDLERIGKLRKIGKGRGMRRKLLGTEELTKTWGARYGDVLRSKLLRGRFKFLGGASVRHWREIGLTLLQGCWGGEPAADLYMDYLQPEKLTIYTTMPTPELAQALRIVPDPTGPVEILDKFWTGDTKERDGQPVVPWLMAYADLLASGESRNLEAAQMLFNTCTDAEGD